jgi:hypothetical protein
MKPNLLLLASLLAFPASAGVYKWTDAQGRVHYSDSPPPAVQSTQLKLQSFTGPVQVSKAIGADSGVTLYTTEWCGVCQRAKAFFRQNGVPFHEWDVEKPITARPNSGSLASAVSRSSPWGRKK